MTRTIPAPTNSLCPNCQGNFETCRCTGVSQLLPALAPRAGVADEIGDLDDRSGDDRAAVADRRARHTLQEMIPGYKRQPVLILHQPAMADDAWGSVTGGTVRHDCPRVTALTEQEREDRSRKVGDVNKRSESRPK
ncbi:hypothetical protein [Streptomyces arboris]|uniref:hypothetical protein n=1 Tax=Streptomyces arboris TaxID=2600619 RepID=UPI00362F383B